MSTHHIACIANLLELLPRLDPFDHPHMECDMLTTKLYRVKPFEHLKWHPLLSHPMEWVLSITNTCSTLIQTFKPWGGIHLYRWWYTIMYSIANHKNPSNSKHNKIQKNKLVFFMWSWISKHEKWGSIATPWACLSSIQTKLNSKTPTIGN
jgi:hypothetical protein